jgi:hypothetical protein
MKEHTFPISPRVSITSTRGPKGLRVVSSDGLDITLDEVMNGAWSERRVMMLIHTIFKDTKKKITKGLVRSEQKK